MRKNCKKLIPLDKVSSAIEKAMTYQIDGKGTVFIHISGHVEVLDIHFHSFSWQAGENPSNEVKLYISEEDFTENDLAEFIAKVDEIVDNAKTGDELEKEVKEKSLARKLETYNKLKEELSL